jgi:hypothetical protein
MEKKCSNCKYFILMAPFNDPGKYIEEKYMNINTYHGRCNYPNDFYYPDDFATLNVSAFDSCEFLEDLMSDNFERGENKMICLIYGENKIISELIEKQFKCECDSSCQVCVNKTMVKCCDCGREISLAKAYIYN